MGFILCDKRWGQVATARRRFVGIDLERERVPDATTFPKFRLLLEVHDLGPALFATLGEVLQAHPLPLREARCHALQLRAGR